MILLFFCITFVLLFLLSRRVTKILSHVFMKQFHSQSIAIHMLSLLFLPGVVLHELSHLLMANILFVPTGQVEFLPEIRGAEVKMGSVSIAKTDPLRRFLIGIAPVVGGVGIMLIASTYLTSTILSWQSVLLLYVFFQVGNTMFSSSKDMEGAIGFLVGLLLIGLILQLFGVQILQTAALFFQNPVVEVISIRITEFLLFAMGLDIFLVLLFEGLSRL